MPRLLPHGTGVISHTCRRHCQKIVFAGGGVSPPRVLDAERRHLVIDTMAAEVITADKVTEEAGASPAIPHDCRSQQRLEGEAALAFSRIEEANAVGRSCIITDLFRSGAVVLVTIHWLREMLRSGGNLVRRQDLPTAAFATSAESCHAVGSAFWDTTESAVVISHGWLHELHPDPNGVRNAALMSTDFRASFLFMDFLSLHQKDQHGDRAENEQALFGAALKNMHLMFSHALWRVCRLVEVPVDAVNSVSYKYRGWCRFETLVACCSAPSHELLAEHHRSLRPWNVIRTWQLKELMGDRVFTVPAEVVPVSEVPLLPDEFAAELDDLHFASPNVDRAMVVSLYRRLWPTLTKQDGITFVGWGDEELAKFERLLPEFDQLRTVHLVKVRASVAQLARFHWVCLKRHVQVFIPLWNGPKLMADWARRAVRPSAG